MTNRDDETTGQAEPPEMISGSWPPTPVERLAQPARLFVGAAEPIRPLSVEAARRALGEASATLADTESKLIEVEAKREKLLAKQADAQRRRDRALEALRSIHADELLDGPAPHAVENGHLEGVS